jgi:hypothetical protein
MARDVAGLDARSAVVAVGSNASPTVMRDKLTRAGRNAVVPMVVGVVDNVAVGHSAHVSIRGYLPAAPMRRPGARTRVVVSFLDDAQLRAIDDTEGNYDRVIVTEARHEVMLVLHEVRPGSNGDGWAEQLSEFHLYRSQHGLLRIDGETMFFPRQVEVSGWLAAQRVAPWDGHDPAEVSAQLSQDRALRDRAFRAFRERDLVIDDGLGTTEALTRTRSRSHMLGGGG